jgi:hypothetical protein
MQADKGEELLFRFSIGHRQDPGDDRDVSDERRKAFDHLLRRIDLVSAEGLESCYEYFHALSFLKE